MRIRLVGLFFALVAISISATSAFANDPFGGPPSSSSGDGITTQGAIYIGEGCTPAVSFPAGSSRWFKVETGEDYKLQIWLDDSPLWGAALNYFENSPHPATSDQSPNKINGYWLRVYAPDALNTNYFWGDEEHRMDLLTTDDGIRPDGSEVPWVGMANFNKFVANHLLWYEARFNGWVYLRVQNQMQWNDNAVVCVGHEYSPKPEPERTPQPDGDNPLVECDWDCKHPGKEYR